MRSIVGRFLEHSRIFRFGSDKRGARYYIGSADLMQRNLDRRVECVAPVTDPALTRRLEEILSVNLADDVLAWELGPDGWRKVPTKVGVNAQERLQALAEERAAPQRLAGPSAGTQRHVEEQKPTFSAGHVTSSSVTPFHVLNLSSNALSPSSALSSLIVQLER